MLSKPLKNYILNIGLLLLGIMSLITGTALALKTPFLMPLFMNLHIKALHEWASYALTVFVVLHLFFHFDWIKAMTRSFFIAK